MSFAAKHALVRVLRPKVKRRKPAPATTTQLQPGMCSILFIVIFSSNERTVYQPATKNERSSAVDIKNNLVICKTNSSALVRTMRRLSKPPKKHLYVTLSQMFVFFQRHLPTKPTPPEQRLDKRRLLVEAPQEDPAVGLAG